MTSRLSGVASLAAVDILHFLPKIDDFESNGKCFRTILLGNFREF